MGLRMYREIPFQYACIVPWSAAAMLKTKKNVNLKCKALEICASDKQKNSVIDTTQFNLRSYF